MKSSPLSLRSADNANYSEVQALKDRIAKLTAEKEYLKGQYDQQKTQDKASCDSLQTQHNNLLAQHNNLNIQYGALQNNVNNLQNHIVALRNNANNNIRNLIQNLIDMVRAGILQGDANATQALNQILDFVNNI